MPKSAPRPCTAPACGSMAMAGASRCAVHLSKQRKENDARRGNAAARGYSGPWQKARASFLRSRPLCVECEARGQAVPATVVDHIVPHGIDRSKGEPTAEQSRLFWDTSNWQPLCAACHHDKTRRLDGFAFFSELLVPAWLEPAAVPLTIVCGPIGAGKSHYIERHRAPGDFLIDLDEIKAELSGCAIYQAPETATRSALIERNRRLARLARLPSGQAWLQLTAPKASERQRWRDLLRPVRIVVLETAPELCKRRIAGDARRPRPQEHARLVEEWWANYSSGREETVIRQG